MSNLGGLRGRLLSQAALTALYALAGRGASSGWTVPTVVVAVGAVFVAIAMRPEPSWRWVVTGYEGFAVAYGLVALMSAHYVPGTIIAAYTLYFLLQHGAAAFAGAPAWDASSIPLPALAPSSTAPVAEPVAEPVAPVQYAPPALPVYEAPAPVAMTAPAPVQYAPPLPVIEAAVEVPAQPPAPRPVAMTILPGK